MTYVELHCHSAYSFLDGASHPAELAGTAAEQGHSALAITDHDGLHGAMEMAHALKPLGIRPITGAELTLADGTHITLLCETREGYTNLCRIITASHWPTRRWAREGWTEGGGRQDPLDGEPSISLEALEPHAAGLVCLSGCARSGAVASRVEAGRFPEAAGAARRLLGIFGPDRFRVELQRPFWRHDRRRNRLLAELAERLGVPTVATGNVHVHARERIALQDAMVAVGLGKTLDETEPQRRGNSSHVLAPPERMAERFREHPDAVEESGRLAERLSFDLTEDLGYRYPGSEDPDADSKLAALCADRFDERYDSRNSEAAAVARRLARIFGRDGLRIELQRPFWRHDRRRNRLLAELAGRLGVPTVATGNAHVHARERIALQDAMVAVGLGKTLDETEPQRRGNSSHVLAPPERMAERFRDHPDAVDESGRLAERLGFDLTEDLGYRYPGSEDPDADSKLAALCADRFAERYGSRRARGRREAAGGAMFYSEASARLDEELRVIRHLGLSGFFLLHRDMLELAREVAAEVRGPESSRRLLPPGRGRGSSVSSIVCYLTGLSHVDPIANELLLGRFLNEELTALPDIDLDFPRDIREVLIPRVHDRYGRDRCALVAAFSTFQVRSAVRDFAKALGLPPGEIERLARQVDP
ncbi:MAG TPA: PHP domain-containing protein, partial [Thermoleophilaceae bacterium]|nr:PHP domain-containing protein [Thermoleophilaceae bacterium]